MIQAKLGKPVLRILAVAFLISLVVSPLLAQPSTIRATYILREPRVVGFNQRMKSSGVDPGTTASLSVLLWDLVDSPLVDANTWRWCSINATPETLDIIDAEMEDLLPVPTYNVPGPEGQGSSYRDDDAGGPWSNSAILMDLTRKPDQLQVFTEPPGET